MRLPFGAAPAGDMFQHKITTNVFHIVVIVCYINEGKGHDRMLGQVMWINLNKCGCHFRCIRVPFFGKIISRCSV